MSDTNGDCPVEPAQPANSPEAAAIGRQLAEPFSPDELKYKPQVVQGNRALAVIYVDARVVQDRLDRVFGVDGWETTYTPQADGCVYCELSCRFPSGWVKKGDVGAQSEQKDAGDRMKASFSDALKRAAVHFGIGRYLYRMGGAWLDYDPKTRQVLGSIPLQPHQLPYGYSPPARERPAPRTLPAAGSGRLPSPQEMYKALSAQVARYAKMIKQPPDQVTAALFRRTGLVVGMPLEQITEAQWATMASTVNDAVAKSQEAEAAR